MNYKEFSQSLVNLPKEMTSQDQFCLWKPDQNNGKAKKIPYTISMFNTPIAQFPSGNFTSFNRLQSLLKKHREFKPGFYLKDSGLSVIDIDNYDSDNYILTKIIIDLSDKGCYIEISPGGHGLHIFYSGFLDWTNGRNKSYSSLESNRAKGTSCEVYTSEDVRFITLTGAPVFSSSKIDPNNAPFLPVAEDIKEELMRLKELFFLDPNLKDQGYNLMNSTLSAAKVKPLVINEESSSFKPSEKLQLVIAKIKASIYYEEFLSFSKELKLDKHNSISETDMAFAGLMAAHLPGQWSIDEKAAIITESFRCFRSQREKIQDRLEYVVKTAYQALFNSNTYYSKKNRPALSAKVSRQDNVIDRNIVLKMCNIMQIFHLGKSYPNFRYVNQKKENNSLLVTSPESLTTTDLKYFMAILFQYKDLSRKAENISKDGFFELNIKELLKSINLTKSGRAYQAVSSHLLKLSKVHLQYHKLIDSERNLYCEYAGSLLSYELDYHEASLTRDARRWKKVKVKLASSILQMMDSAEYNYSLLNKASYQSFPSDKLKLLYFYFCQNTLPGKGVKVFTVDHLLSLWPPSDTRSTLNSRKKELTRLLTEFSCVQGVIKDLIIETVYENEELIEIKVRKKNLRPV